LRALRAFACIAPIKDTLARTQKKIKRIDIFEKNPSIRPISLLSFCAIFQKSGVSKSTQMHAIIRGRVCAQHRTAV